MRHWSSPHDLDFALHPANLACDLVLIERGCSQLHGDDDQIVPIGPSAHASSKLVKHATLKIYAGGSHGLADTNTDQLNTDLLAFLAL